MSDSSLDLEKSLRKALEKAYMPVLILSTSHNALVGRLILDYAQNVKRSVVLQNGTLVKVFMRGGRAVFELLTEDSVDKKYITQAEFREMFPDSILIEGIPDGIYYYVRHGEGEHNVKINHVNPSLTAKGNLDAIMVGNRIKTDLEQYVELYNLIIQFLVSPLRRTKQTAVLMARQLGIVHAHGDSCVHGYSGDSGDSSDSSNLFTIVLALTETTRQIGLDPHCTGAAVTIYALSAFHPVASYRTVPGIVRDSLSYDDLEKLVEENKFIVPDAEELQEGIEHFEGYNFDWTGLIDALKDPECWTKAASKTLLQVAAEYVR
jgi:hypothetical protein